MQLAAGSEAVLLVGYDGAATGPLAHVSRSEGLLGGNFVELLPGGAVDNLAPGDEIEDTQGAVSLITLLLKFVGGGDGDQAPAQAEP